MKDRIIISLPIERYNELVEIEKNQNPVPTAIIYVKEDNAGYPIPTITYRIVCFGDEDLKEKILSITSKRQDNLSELESKIIRVQKKWWFKLFTLFQY